MKTKRLLSILVALCMIMQIIPVFAEDTATEETVVSDSYGVIFSDTFDDGTACGWVSGAGKAVTLTPETLETGEKVLKAEMPVINMAATWAANGELSTVTKGVENVVEFTGSNLIRIKARVKNTEADDSYLIKVNRPNATSTGIPLRTAVFNVYMVSGINGGKPMYGQGISTSAGVTNSYKNMAALPFTADGAEFDYTDVDLTGKWVDYTIVINGATNEQWVTASFENNGETVTLTENHSVSTFLQTDQAYSTAGRSEEKTFAGFERLTFASRDSASDSTIYIDSVSVENLEIISAGGTNLTGKTIAPGEAFRLQLLTDAEISEVPEGALTVSGVTGTQTYNAEEKVIYFTPDSDITEGAAYTLAVNTSRLASNGITYTGDTSFSIKGVGERFTAAGYVINDDFNDGTAQGWASGVGNTVTLTPETLETGEAVLKVELPKINAAATWAANGQQSTITKLAGNGIPYAENNIVKITARIKNEAANDVYAIKANRPNQSDLPILDGPYFAYALAGFNGGAPRYGQGISTVGAWSEAYKNMSSLLNADGTAFDYTAVDLTGKWIDYTILINELTGEYTVKASFENNGEAVTVVSGSNATSIQPTAAYTKEYGSNTTKRSFNNFERLTIGSVDSTDGAVLYIDQIAVENIVIQDVSAEYTGSAAIEPNGSVSVKLSGEITSVPEGAVEIDGVKTTKEFDSETKTLTLTPVTPLDGGKTYTVVIDSEVLASNGFTLKGEASFAFTTTGYAVNDNFDDGTAQNWVSGAGNAVTITPETLTTGEKVLKLEMPKITASATWAANNAQSGIIKETNIKFTGDNLIRIKARIKNTDANDNYLIRVNRPNATSTGVPLHDSLFNTYAVSGLRSGQPLYGSGISSAGGVTNSYKNMSSLSNKADGSAFDYTSVDLAGKWIDYTILINGATNEQWVTASFDNNGEAVTLISGEASTFLQPDTTYGLAGRTEQKTFEAFERLTLSSYDSTDGATLYVDSVSVENILPSTASAEYTSEALIDTTASVTVKFTGDITAIPENAVTVAGADVTQSFNPETKVLTITPVTAFENGKGYIIALNSAVFAANGISIEGETEFNFATAGTVFADDFNDGTTQGWAAGVGGSAALEAVTLDSGEKVLKAELGASGVGTTWVTLYESNIFKEISDIPFTENNVVRIKAKVKNASSYLIKVNRPDALGTSGALPLYSSSYNHWTVAGKNDGAPVYGAGIDSNSVGTNIYKCFKAFAYKEDGAAVNVSEIDFSDKWIEYTITINGATNEQTVTAAFEHNGETLTLVSGSDSTFLQPDGAYTALGLEEKKFSALERLTFSSRDFSAASTLYIDSVSVENIIINSSPEAATKFLVNGEASLNGFKNGDAVKAQFTLNAKGVEKTYTLISAIYVNGQLDDIHVNNVTTEGVTTYTEETGFTVNAEDLSKVEIKAFVWATSNGLGTLKPVCGVNSINPDLSGED